MKKQIRKNKGITLIALVVTVLVPGGFRVLPHGTQRDDIGEVLPWWRMEDRWC